MTTLPPAVSAHLNASQLRAIDKLGDSMLPGDGELPAFSATGCVRHVDRVLDQMGAQDLADLKLLLSLLAVLPRIFIGLFLRVLELVAPVVPGPPGAILRLMRIGLRGLIMTLYYGDDAIARAVGYEVNVYTADLPAGQD